MPGMSLNRPLVSPDQSRRSTFTRTDDQEPTARTRATIRLGGNRGWLARVWVLAVALIVPVLPAAAEVPQAVEAQRGLVVSVSEPGSEAGLQILRLGGNAVDAAVATALAMAVTYPPAGNIGGGGFMMIHPGPGQPPVCVEYRETAPAAATKTMFSLDDSSYGHKIVGVPGTVRGMALAHERYGKLPWKILVMPAVKLAEEGYIVDAALAASLNSVLKNAATKPYTEMQRVYTPPNGSEWQAGDRMIQPDLARTMRHIAEGGPDAFYEGPIAEQIVAEMQQGGGLITAEDLAGYRAKIRKPIHTTYRGHDVYGPPPPSSGGTCLALMLNILEPFELREKGRWSPATLHLMTEAMRRAYLDRARYLGDQDFVDIPAHLTDKAYAAKLAQQIDAKRATSSEALADDIPLAGESDSTTHFSVIDADGMAVSNTYTLENSYGSRVVVRGAGFLLNNEMGDFNWKPGHTDRRGRIGTDANVIAPGKRMLSSQTPVLVACDGRVVLVTGSPGGRTIINTVLCVVLNVLEFEMDLPAAVAAPRMHHQWLPDVARFEADDQSRIQPAVEKLNEWGHKTSITRRQGDAHSIWVDPQTGRYHGVADPRIHGKASGF
jgi:gamma-glutamyltranspeptidase / glutathione hydrolase